MSSSGSVALMLAAHLVHHVPDGAAALRLELDGEVAGVGLGDRGEAQLQPVRREVFSTSGIECRMRSTCSSTRLVSASELPAGMM